ncbi:MAG TPA: hypothetical protein PLZ57_08715 [Pseudobdellovibrionaceae bacterium]|nr:hypothetical protein [Pseudobdellovibrionaceae bacterium]
MSSYANASQIKMWKTLVALTHVDHDTNQAEREFISDFLEKSKLSPEEKAEILSGFGRAESPEKLFQEIKDSRDRARLLYLARVMFYHDQDFSTYEQMALEHLESLHMKKFDLDALRPALGEVEKQVESRWAVDRPQSFRDRFINLLDLWFI